jgi:Permease for cytosine/purines, uracil, thiamine, allantoin
MDPVPPEKRTWTTWNYIAYWISDATNAGIWQLASSMLSIGLSWRQALPAIAVAHCIIAVATHFILQPNRLLDIISPGCHGLKRNHWCSIARCFPCTKSIIVRILVELLHRD